MKQRKEALGASPLGKEKEEGIEVDKENGGEDGA
jgi:hypothetical protein